MHYLLLLICALTGCQSIPSIAKDIESIETDNAIKIEVSRKALNYQTDLQINLNVQNKDEPVQNKAS